LALPHQRCFRAPVVPAPAGAQFVASKIEALAANEDLWNSTVFILNYDENDGFFDHVPPVTPTPGTADEFVTLNSPGGTPGGGLPIGSGFRVPAIIVSPWTVGGFVCIDPFDHTSTLSFIERVTGVAEPNISNWRRRTFGDFTAAFQRSPEPAPAIPAATASATAAELAFQTSQSTLPCPHSREEYRRPRPRLGPTAHQRLRPPLSVRQRSPRRSSWSPGASISTRAVRSRSAISDSMASPIRFSASVGSAARS
jgi:phospholipase C